MDNTTYITYSKYENNIKITKTKIYKKKYVNTVMIISMTNFRKCEKTYIKKTKKIIKRKHIKKKMRIMIMKRMLILMIIMIMNVKKK